MCGSGHYSMRGIVIVETQEEYDAWLGKLTPQYAKVMDGKKEQAPGAAAPADSTKVSSTPPASKPIAKN
jgi:cytochrome c oxidase subunit II